MSKLKKFRAIDRLTKQEQYVNNKVRKFVFIMMRFFTNILIVLLVTTSAVVSSASAFEVKSNCCCAEIINNIDASIQNDCACCSPIPNHKLPNNTVQIQIKKANIDLQTSALRILTDNKQTRIHTFIDRRRPLHLASNELYLRKRALLI